MLSHAIDSLTIRRPDDWHVHLRDATMLAAVASYTARQFARAIVMPNLATPVTTIALAEAYRELIVHAVGDSFAFTPLMTCYLTDGTDRQEIEQGFARKIFTAAKLYPANATTNSANGVSDIANLDSVFSTMQDIGMPLLIHGEVTDDDVDIFDREKAFIDRSLKRIVDRFPSLKIVFEHITTSDAVAFVDSAGPNVAATITPQHLHINRNAMLVGGIHPHAYCLPVAKREEHRLALRKAAISGSPQYFLGTDSAPHSQDAKENACGCAGIFNAPFALESYVTVFDEDGALDKFEAFASQNGARFYGLPLNEGTVTLERSVVQVPEFIDAAGMPVVPFHAGQTLAWSLRE